MKIKNIGVVANLTKYNALSITGIIKDFFTGHKVNVILEQNLAKSLKIRKSGMPVDKLAKKADLVISLGGDGTFLRVARATQKHLKPILGVNLGSLGFLAEVTLDSLLGDLELLVKGNYKIDYRMTLNTEVIKKRGKRIRLEPALNDIVISKKVIARIIDIEAYIEDKPVTKYKADGVIVATPTGSTAYTLSAGGPIVHPGAEVILISPICPHTLTHRPLVVPSNDKIKFKVSKESEGVILTVDGQICVDLESEDCVLVSKGLKKVPLITFRDTLYFNVLQQKLNWGSR